MDKKLKEVLEKMKENGMKDITSDDFGRAFGIGGWAIYKTYKELPEEIVKRKAEQMLEKGNPNENTRRYSSDSSRRSFQKL